MVLNSFIKVSRKYLFLSAAMLLMIIGYSCSEDSNPVINSNYENIGKSALIIVVENNDGLLNDNLEVVYQYYKQPMLALFSELFGIDKSEMQDMSLNQIVETYGEPWQINQIKKYAVSHYDTIVALRNEDATEMNLKSYLQKFSASNFTIDMVFCLHGNSHLVEFYNYASSEISEFGYFIKSNKINLRMLYQTCCYAGQALDTWKLSGIYAVNGASGLNNITLFSPGYFMDEWVNGATFEESVKRAFQRDTAKIGSYNDRIPIINYLLTPDNINGSIQFVSGKDTKITIHNFLKATVL